MTARPKIDIIDDDPAMRDSLSFLLDVNGFDVRAHESATAFLEHVRTAVPDCVVSDIRMPNISGIELVRILKAEGMPYPVIAITGHGDIALAVEAMKAGASDFIEKPFDNEVLLTAIHSALSTKPASGAEARRNGAKARLSGLSSRERDVLEGLLAGKINKTIAHDLGISPRTIEIYRANLMAKTGARSISELMRLALEAGL